MVEVRRPLMAAAAQVGVRAGSAGQASSATCFSAPAPASLPAAVAVVVQEETEEEEGW